MATKSLVIDSMISSVDSIFFASKFKYKNKTLWVISKLCRRTNIAKVATIKHFLRQIIFVSSSILGSTFKV